MGISDDFQTLLARINPLQSELDKAARHAGSIEARLKASFDLSRFFIAGSHSRETAIRTYSDVDYFAVISRNDARWGGSYKDSRRVLGALRSELLDRFPYTDVGRDGQAIVVRFEQGASAVDVVPAVFHTFGNRAPIYLIPDGAGDWMQTSPEAHNNFIFDADKTSAGKLRRTVRLLKAWREMRQDRVPINSFHLEIVLADSGICAGVKSYSQCLFEAFHLLHARGCAAIQDPLGISGLVAACNTEAKRDRAIRSVRYAYEHAESALVAEQQGDLWEARRQWDLVFNGGFPK